jgi:chorismate mutase
MSRNLTELRAEISSIDEKILALLTERMNLSVLVALFKKNHNLPIFDPKREEEMLLRYEEKVDFECSSIFRAIIDESKRIQKGIL